MPDSRPFKKLPDQEWKVVAKETRAWLEEGGCQRNLPPELLVYPDGAFSTKRFPGHRDSLSFLNPPEFVTLSFAALDAFALTLLTAPDALPPAGKLHLCCSLEQGAKADSLRLQLVALLGPEPVRASQNDSNHILHTILLAMQARQLGETPIFLRSTTGCSLDFKYPGQMIASKSPFLRDRPPHEWPMATLTFDLNSQLTESARVALLRLIEPQAEQEDV